MHRIVFVAASVLVAIAGVSTSSSTQAATQGRWVIRDLGTFGTASSVAADINERGQIVGWAGLVGHMDPHAFIWQKGKMRSLGTLGGQYSSAIAINDRGQVVGWAETAKVKKNTSGHKLRHAFLWQNGRIRDLGTLGGPESKATAINERGQIVGVAETKAKNADGETTSHAFLWQSGAIRDLDKVISVKAREAAAINERGQVVGWSAGGLINWDTTVEQGWAYLGAEPFLWHNGTLRTLGRIESAALAINDRGQIVGIQNPARALLWRKGKVWDLGTLGGGRWSKSGASDINNRGQVVGWSQTNGKNRWTPGPMHAFLWQDQDRMVDLGTLPGGGRSAALAINDEGQIVGWSETGTGSSQAIIGQHAVLWTYKP